MHSLSFDNFKAIDKASIAASIKCKDDLCSLMRVYYPEIYQHIITCLKQRPDKIHQIPVDYKEDSAENYVMMKVFSGVISTVFSTVYLLPTVVFIWDQFIVQRSFRLWPYFICCHLSLLEKEVYTCRSERELFATINQRRPEISPRVIRETFISKFHDIYLQITKEQQPSKTSFSLYYNEKEKEQQKKPASYIHQATTPVHEEDDQYSNYEGESVNFIEDDDASASQPDVSDEVIPVEVKEIQIRRKKKRFFEYIRSVRHWLKYLKAVRELTRKHKIERLERVEDDVQAISDHNIYESFWINTTFEGRRVKLCIPEIHRGIDKISDTIARVFDHPQNEKQWKVLPTEWKKTESELTQRIVDEILAKYDDIENDLGDQVEVYRINIDERKRKRTIYIRHPQKDKGENPKLLASRAIRRDELAISLDELMKKYARYYEGLIPPNRKREEIQSVYVDQVPNDPDEAVEALDDDDDDGNIYEEDETNLPPPNQYPEVLSKSVREMMNTIKQLMKGTPLQK
eukprot:TRINITY_DN3935_c0_g1_i2.p1 TRINITY_DN3935_c0_g1~~TRINITY_DN3935_c0_g1_i2.p1  ORF type:complete len:516 (-),score=88.03 TRINITY_DN3935_c0_g1_i2:121-1668(-)